MADIINERRRAEISDDFVLFLIGMRINRFRAVREWVPVATGMARMLRELETDPNSGLLGYRGVPGLRNTSIVQYWESPEKLHEYAYDRLREHFPAWGKYNQGPGRSGAVGIWHETYLIDADGYETVYNNMPRFGLGEVGRLVPAGGSALDRLIDVGTVDAATPPSEE